MNLKGGRSVLDWLGQQLGVKTQPDWYRITSDEFKKVGGRSLLQKHTSLSQTLSTYYPEFIWKSFLFETTRLGYQSIQSQREMLDWIGEQLGIETQSNWYKHTLSDIRNLGGSSLLHQHNNSLHQLLSSAYYEFEWKEFLFTHLPHLYWKKQSNQRQFLDWAAEQLQIERQHDWYNFTVRDLDEIGGTSILIQNNYSLLQSVRFAYPEFEWDPLHYKKAPNNFFKDKENHRIYMDRMGALLNITRPQQWLSVSYDKLREVGALGFLRSYGTLQKALESVYPEHNWASIKSSYRGQQILQDMLKAMASTPMLIEHKLWSPKLGCNLELDVYLPEVSLAFEYQGGQHYTQATGHFGDISDQKQRDAEKQRLCQEKGITLVEIPYWWDYSARSLASTVHKYRPDVKLTIPDFQDVLSRE